MRQAVLLLSVLAACTGGPGADPDVVSLAGETGESTPDLVEDKTLADCGADVVLDVIGATVDAAGERLPSDKWVIAPGSVVTQDYVPKRMNVFLNDRGVITRLSCG